MNLKEFLSELQRRKVYRVSIAYGVAAWLIAQISDLIATNFEAEPWVMKMIITILILGFPVTIVLSWIFDIGPKGIERTQPKDETSKNSEPMTVKLVVSIIVFLIVVILGGRWSLKQFDSPGPGERTINSLAVLPFDNFTGNDSLEYFVAGMQSSLIGDMQKISALRVPSKTSSSSFKGKNATIPEIADQLKVEAAVEGSITCLGDDSICVQVRLISAFPEEKQLWVQDYQIDKKEILNFYNKVTKEISREIDVMLTPEEDRLLAVSRTVNPGAYDAYLKGLYYWEKLDQKSVQRALEFFQLASELDPDWADPYAGLANAWGLFSFFGFLPESVTLPKVYPNLNKALELDPNSAQAHYVAAILAVWTEWDWEKGEREFLRSLELNPHDALCRMYYAHLLMILRRTDEANEQARIGLQLDPMKPLVLGLYGVVARNNNNDMQGARQAFEKSLSIDPNFGFSRFNLTQLMIENAYLEGDYETWIKLWQDSVSKGMKWNDEGKESVLQAYNRGGHMAAIEAMLRMNEKFGDACNLPDDVKIYMLVETGQTEKAMDFLDTLFESRSSGCPYGSPRYHFYELLKDNPRYIAFLEKMNLPT